MRATDYRTLINRGRKAGLRTAELYTAIAGRRPEIGDQVGGVGDGNGFVAGFDARGQHVVFHPSTGRASGG
jgi:hypothetical protein